MSTRLQYVIDNRGHANAVLVPLALWEKIKNELSAMKNKATFFNQLTKSFDEIEKFRKGKTALKTLDEFLDEI